MVCTTGSSVISCPLSKWPNTSGGCFDGVVFTMIQHSADGQPIIASLLTGTTRDPTVASTTSLS